MPFEKFGGGNRRRPRDAQSETLRSPLLSQSDPLRARVLVATIPYWRGILWSLAAIIFAAGTTCGGKRIKAGEPRQATTGPTAHPEERAPPP